MPEQKQNSALETRGWICLACGCSNVEFPPYPVLEVMCESCGGWTDADIALTQSTAEVS